MGFLQKGATRFVLNMLSSIQKIAAKSGWLLCFLCLGLGLFGAERHYRRCCCKRLDIRIAPVSDQRMVFSQDVVELLALRGLTPRLGRPFCKVPIQRMAHAVRKHHCVRSVVVSRCWPGTIRVDVTPRRLLARCMHQQGAGYYIDEEGGLVPAGGKRAARVLVVEIDGLKPHSKTCLGMQGRGAALMDLLRYIDSNPFWRAQIAAIRMDAAGQVTMHTQVGRQRIVFGKLKGMEKKFRKLKAFYRKIAPIKGWNTYRCVNLAFDRQIICK